jgi:hypothetical protein
MFAHWRMEQYSFFVRQCLTERVKACGAISLRPAFTPTVVLFVLLPETESKADPGVTEIPLELLPRLCPLCGERTIIGHGQRLKQAHDQRHQQIWIRRGRCRPCQKTFTVLPDWSPPSGHYTLRCRQQAYELLRQRSNWERSVPDVADLSRSPDSSTVRRWAGRLLQLAALLAARLWQAIGCSLSLSPTILAWDWTAIRRILPLEASSP